MTFTLSSVLTVSDISIHTVREDDDVIQANGCTPLNQISIHTVREDDDTAGQTLADLVINFNPHRP